MLCTAEYAARQEPQFNTETRRSQRSTETLLSVLADASALRVLCDSVLKNSIRENITILPMSYIKVAEKREKILFCELSVLCCVFTEEC